VPMLTEMLRPADIELLGVQFSELARDEHLLDAYEPISMIVALIGTFPDLRAVAARHHAPLFGLVVELSDEAQRALIELPSEGQIALIAQQRYLPSARALLRQYFIPDERVRFTTPTNVATVRRLVQASPIIVHTLAAGRIVRELAPPSAHVVEMLYRPNPASVARLRELLAANRSPAGPGRVPVPPATRAEQAGRLAVEAVTIT
jgi:hypothetical protein